MTDTLPPALERPTTSVRVTGSCGESMEIALCVDQGRILDGGLRSEGCEHSRACGLAAVMLALGRDLDEAAAIDTPDILAVLPDLPEDHHHCLDLAARTLHAAVDSARKQA